MGKLSENRKEAGRKRRAEILGMLERKLTLAEIGEIQGGVTRQRISQLVRQARKERETETAA